MAKNKARMVFGPIYEVSCDEDAEGKVFLSHAPLLLVDASCFFGDCRLFGF